MKMKYLYSNPVVNKDTEILVFSKVYKSKENAIKWPVTKMNISQ